LIILGNFIHLGFVASLMRIGERVFYLKAELYKSTADEGGRLNLPCPITFSKTSFENHGFEFLLFPEIMLRLVFSVRASPGSGKSE